MAGNDATARFFEALNEGSDAVIDAIRAANNRNHRVSTALIESAQEGQREAMDLAKKWINAPMDIAGLYSHVIETATRAQSRSLEVTRQWLSEMADAQKETRDILQRFARANRTVNEAGVDVARGAFSRATTAVQSATGGPADGRRVIRSAEVPAAAEEA